MIRVYRALTRRAEPLFNRILNSRLTQQKEDAARIHERKGIPSTPRGEGLLLWLHAASVGEAQSALILINALLELDKTLRILVTTGTQTSATLMEKNLPERAFHQFYPLDHPKWCEQFITHWQPNCAIWIESELWPNMLNALKSHNIPAALVNAKMSQRSFSRWRFLKRSAARILKSFDLVLAQTDKDAQRLSQLGAQNVTTIGNLKYSAAPLPVDDANLAQFKNAILKRPVWLYASTHHGEEAMACRAHTALKEKHTDLLTIVVPRHPERGEDIKVQCENLDVKTFLRDDEKSIPKTDTDIYIANTLGELGLFYRAANIACIGRSFSDDGGGGHNPIEAAQLNCAVLCGPNVQNLQDIYDNMKAENALLQCATEQDLIDTLDALLSDERMIEAYQQRASEFAEAKNQVLEHAMHQLIPFLEETGGLNASAKEVR